MYNSIGAIKPLIYDFILSSGKRRPFSTTKMTHLQRIYFLAFGICNYNLKDFSNFDHFGYIIWYLFLLFLLRLRFFTNHKLGILFVINPNLWAIWIYFYCFVWFQSTKLWGRKNVYFSQPYLLDSTLSKVRTFFFLVRTELFFV